MNEWVQKSIEIANGKGYLDKLHEVYPVLQEVEREISAEVKKDLRKIYKTGDNLELIKTLLKLPKFPVKDPYVAFLRKKEFFLSTIP